MPIPSTYLDENVDVELAGYLERRGYGVTTAQAAGTAGLDDEGQLAYAATGGLLLLSTTSGISDAGMRSSNSRGDRTGGSS